MNQIKNYVEAMFSSLPKTKEVVEMKVNIIENMEEKFKELLNEGKNENEAIGIVISQFGNIDELKKELGIDDFNNKINVPSHNSSINNLNNNNNEKLKKEYYDFKKKTPLFYTIAVMLYILAPLFFLVSDNMAGEDSIFSYILFFSLIAIATGIFVYFGSRNNQYAKMLGIQNISDDNDDNNPFNGFVFTIATAIFLILGFTKNLWHPGWIIFIIASAITTLLDYFYKNKKTKKL